MISPASFVLPRRRILAAALASIVPFTAAGAETPANLPDVLVTGVRHAQTVDDALAAVTVITREDIEKSPEVDLVSLLAHQAGVDVSRTGGAGQSSTVFVRGANSNQTLVLIDGIRVAAATNSVFDFSNLPLDQIQRIEIVRGPRAAYWGSDAIGGVIQIFTRHPDRLALRADAGSYGQRGGGVAFGTPAGEDELGATFGIKRQRGFSATNPANAFGFNPDDDGYRNRSASVRGRIQLGTQSLAVTAVHTDGDAEFDAGPSFGPDTTRSNARNTSGGATLSGPVAGIWSQSLTFGGAQNDIDTPAFGSRTSSRRTSVDWVNTFAMPGRGTIVLGGNWQHVDGTSISAFSASPDGVEYRRSTTNAAGFLGYDASFGAHQVEVAVRHDDNSQFGGATTGTAAWGWRIDPAWRVRASWGQGFRAPSFDELYSPGFGAPPFAFFAGNAFLRPEHSQSVEAGIEFHPSAAHAFTLSSWRTRVHDLIAFEGANFDAINIERARLDGTELGYRYTGARWNAGLAATFQDPRNDTTGDPLLRRPKRKLAGEIRHDFGNGWDVSADGLLVAAREDFGGVRLGGYGLVGLAAGWSFHPGWRAELRLNNLFDKDYALAQGYNVPGRNGWVTVSWKPFE